MRIEIEVPGEAPSASNLREHWAVRAKRVASQRGKVSRRLPDRDVLPVCIVVTLTRIAPRRLDPGDNLTGALKGHRDAVATWLRVDDASPLVRWEYAQEKGEAAVRIAVHVAQLDATELDPARVMEWAQATIRKGRTVEPTPNVRGGR